MGLKETKRGRDQHDSKIKHVTLQCHPGEWVLVSSMGTSRRRDKVSLDTEDVKRVLVLNGGHFEVEGILGIRLNKYQYELKIWWRGFPQTEATSETLNVMMEDIPRKHAQGSPCRVNSWRNKESYLRR